MEEAAEISADDDPRGLSRCAGPQNLDQDEQMAIGFTAGSEVCAQPEMVQTTAVGFSQ